MFSPRKRIKTWIVLALVLSLVDTAYAARVKDLVNIQGVRNNQLIGFGLVIGLAGTGDSAINVFFSIQTMVNMLKKMGVTIPSNKVEQLKFKNIATVMLTAELPPFANIGEKIDVVVSSLGDAKSLQGGTLLMTPLKGADGETYAVAQGPISIGGFAAEGAARGGQKNHLHVGRIADGGVVEKALSNNFNVKKEVVLSLKTADFTTASRISRAINSELKDVLANTQDGRAIHVKVPAFYKDNTSGFITKIESLEVDPDTVAKVIIDERTGTVVMGENVRISTVAVAHGTLFVQIRETPQPAAPAQAAAIQGVEPAPAPAPVQVAQRQRVPADEGRDNLLIIPDGVGIGDVVNALNSIGVTPRDLISILQSIKAAGALHAELEII
jgi:flagellar P-ring protein precursor FlgI